MRIAIDASRTTRARVTGTERYALELIRALIDLNDTLDPPHTLTLYFRDAPAPDLLPHSQHVTQRVLPFPRLWTHLRFAAALWGDRPDVIWVPAHTLPFVFPGRAAVTVHDLGYKPYPRAHRRSQVFWLEIYTRWSAWRAQIVLADSEATRRDLNRYYRTPLDKIRVVYPGVTIPTAGDLAAVRHKYALPNHYWLYLGTLQPRKNIGSIVGAYHQWRYQHPDDPAELVLAGGKGWKFEDHWVNGEGIHLPGYIDEADKGTLLAGARALLFPSLYEGFGFPVIEAMGVGTPVICSNTSSLPELAGDAALYVDPHILKMLTERMSRLTTDNDLRDTLIQRGYDRPQHFTWEQAAQTALNALIAAGEHTT